MKMISVFVICLGLIGCVSGYQQFYKPVANLTPEALDNIRATPAPIEPVVLHQASFPTELEISKAGYIVLGYSWFNSGRSETDAGAIEQAKTLRADAVVIINPQHTGSTSSAIPITTPTTSTAYTSSTATAYGSGGSATAYGNSTTTTYGSQTNYIPITTHLYNYGAIYLVKFRYALGLTHRPLNDDERVQLQSNRGVSVTSIIDGSPAFNADILPGDIITNINDERISTGESFNERLNTLRGQVVTLTVSRSAKEMKINVALSE